MEYTIEDIKAQTLSWVEQVVVGFNFCPFAKREVLRNSIAYEVSEANTVEAGLVELAMALKTLEQNEAIETTLLIYPNWLQDFGDYLDFVEMGQVVLEDQGYEGVFQLATFHPDYCFADAPVHDPANFTNRSPYPMLHLLREESLENALEHYDEPETIPERNMEVARAKGLEHWEKILAKCYKLKS